jgi:hypothetical protein
MKKACFAIDRLGLVGADALLSPRIAVRTGDATAREHARFEQARMSGTIREPRLIAVETVEQQAGFKALRLSPTRCGAGRDRRCASPAFPQTAPANHVLVLLLDGRSFPIALSLDMALAPYDVILRLQQVAHRLRTFERGGREAT